MSANQPIDNALLIDYLDASLTLPQIAAKHDIALLDLIAWTERPDIVAAMDTYARACAVRADRLAAAASPKAVEATIMCLQAPNRETVRRAASSIIRITERAQKAAQRETDREAGPRDSHPSRASPSSASPPSAAPSRRAAA